jgi:hypothetical protein
MLLESRYSPEWIYHNDVYERLMSRSRVSEEASELERWILHDFLGEFADDGFSHPGPTANLREFEWLFGLRRLLEDEHDGHDWRWLTRRAVLGPNDYWAHFNDVRFDLAEGFRIFGGIVLKKPDVRTRIRHLITWFDRMAGAEMPRRVPGPWAENAFPIREDFDEAEIQARDIFLAVFGPGSERVRLWTGGRGYDRIARELCRARDILMYRLLQLEVAILVD